MEARAQLKRKRKTKQNKNHAELPRPIAFLFVCEVDGFHSVEGLASRDLVQ